jgi:hypothetical protein
MPIPDLTHGFTCHRCGASIPALISLRTKPPLTDTALPLGHLHLCPAQPVLGRVEDDCSILAVLLERFYEPPPGYEPSYAD